MALSLDDVEKTTDFSNPLIQNFKPYAGKYRQGKTVGSGTFGKVRVYLFRNTEYAVKILHSDHIKATDLIETSLLVRLNHPNVVKVLSIGFDSVISTDGSETSRLAIVMEYAPRTLDFFIQGVDTTAAAYSPKPNQVTVLSYEEKLSLAHQLLSGLGFCHSRGIVHRDVKPTNLLIFNDPDPSAKGRKYVLKLIDFGSACLAHNEGDHFDTDVVTVLYRAPELCLGREESCRDLSIDLWSAGVVIWELFMQRYLFAASESDIHFTEIVQRLGMSDFYRTLPRWNLFEAYFPPKVEVAENSCSHEFSNTRFSSRDDLDDPIGSIYLSGLPLEIRELFSSLTEKIPSERVGCYQLLQKPVFRSFTIDDATPLSNLEILEKRLLPRPPNQCIRRITLGEVKRWLIYIAKKLKQPRAYFHCLRLFHLALDTKTVTFARGSVYTQTSSGATTPSDLEVYGKIALTCFAISSRFCEKDYIKSNECDLFFAKLIGSVAPSTETFSKGYSELERLILEKVSFDLAYYTCYDYFEELVKSNPRLKNISEVHLPITNVELLYLFSLTDAFYTTDDITLSNIVVYLRSKCLEKDLYAEATTFETKSKEINEELVEMVKILDEHFCISTTDVCRFLHMVR